MIDWYEYCKKNPKNLPDVLVCRDAKESHELASVCRFLGINHIVFSDFRASYMDDLRPFKEELFELFGSLRDYYKADKKPLIISPYKTLFYSVPREHMLGSFKLEFASTIDLEELKSKLLNWGYSFVDMIQEPSEVSFRGDIIDIFIPESENPYRISLFDNEIEEIRAFDIDTQRSIGDEIAEIEISSVFFSIDEERYKELENRASELESDSFIKDIDSLGYWVMGEDGYNFLEGKSVLLTRNLSNEIDDSFALDNPLVPREFFGDIELEEAKEYMPLAGSDIELLKSVHKDKKIKIISSSEAQLKAFGIDASGIEIVNLPIVLNVIGPDEVVVSLNKEEKKRRRRKTSILLDDLKVGDYVVHEEYGVGVFVGIEQANILGGVKDLVVLRYLGDDRLLIPVENLEVIDRYIASGSVPVIDRLGKGSFAKLKESVRSKLFEIAGEIVELAAARALIKAPIIEIDKNDLNRFLSNAGFTHTDDQSKAISAIIENLSSGQIMDRLLSGDVGFGKTEVAMAAIFAASKAGYQSLLVVPTTLLSAQHFRSLRDRLGVFGIRVAKIDRFVSTKEKNATLKALSNGEIDCVVGTHALLDVKCQNLGVVIIDEEHKFGVKQKEKLKNLYENVHLLSMSATPIPRSLNQALSSIKTLSELLTPPSERLGVKTFVKSYDEKLIKEVILRELRRGGQVFYVHNSIESMSIKEGELNAILPDLRIVTLHSKITAAKTEEELAKFAAKEYDLLLATSIIESGIHMPTVNTMIIDGADRFGMADLHQLRGRVGRGHIEGYAYFIVDNKDALTDEAKKRLIALESNSFLGSGAMLAYHDLEIRGGGNLIGDAQSGHIKNIGYSLYLRMLEDAIKELTNTQSAKKAKVDIKLAISAFISDEVVSEDRLRIELYRRLSHCEDSGEVYEIYEEMEDRFGKLDTPTKQFLDVVNIKVLALKNGIKSVMNYEQNITFEYLDGKRESIKSASRDDDDILDATLKYLRSGVKKI